MPNIIYPPPDKWWVKCLRFANVLDDDANKLSPTKVNVWGSVIAGVSTAAASVIAFITAHWGILDHVMSIGPLVGTWLGHSFTAHHMDKRERNVDKARMLKASNGSAQATRSDPPQ